MPPVDPRAALSALPPGLGDAPLDSETAAAVLAAVGIGGDGLPDDQAPLLALIEALPRELVERLLVELLARLVEPA